MEGNEGETSSPSFGKANIFVDSDVLNASANWVRMEFSK
jgi:hypothetical protein